MSSKPKEITLDENPGGRASNWLEATSRALVGHLPEIEGCNDYVTQRLSALLLERLPGDLGRDLIELLPDHERENARPLHRSLGNPNPSIGYPDFVQRALFALGCQRRFDRDALDELSTRTADAFLWAFAQEVPIDLKYRIAQALPVELRSRMNLYTGHDESAKVA